MVPSVVMNPKTLSQLNSSGEAARSLAPKFTGLLRSSSSPPLLHSSISLPILTQIKKTMNSEQGNRQRVCRKSNSIDPPSPAISRMSKMILDTPCRTYLLTDTCYTVNKLSYIQLFKIYNVISRITDCQIIKKRTIHVTP